MATQINPALARLWIANNTRQYGYRNFTQLTELQPRSNSQSVNKSKPRTSRSNLSSALAKL
jgi:hypothetical protein